MDNNNASSFSPLTSSLWVDGHRHGWAGWPLSSSGLHGADYVAGYLQGRKDRDRIEMKLHVEGALKRLRADRSTR